MGRPKVPLISKRKALEVALDIIDNEGIESLSIRRLAERLKVNGASLYHHFENKEEIVVGAAKLALDEVRTPDTTDEPWRIWVLRNNRSLRQAFREHPDLVPVMLRRQPLGIGLAQMDATVARLEEQNVPTGAIVPMLEALELYAIGSALHEARADSEPDTDLASAPNLARASDERALSPDEIFDLVCEKIVDTTVMAAIESGGYRTARPVAGSNQPEHAAPPKPQRSRRKSA